MKKVKQSIALILLAGLVSVNAETYYTDSGPLNSSEMQELMGIIEDFNNQDVYIPRPVVKERPAKVLVIGSGSVKKVEVKPKPKSKIKKKPLLHYKKLVDACGTDYDRRVVAEELTHKGDYSTALDLWKYISEEYSDYQAMKRVALLYRGEFTGIKQDLRKALYWARMAISVRTGEPFSLE